MHVQGPKRSFFRNLPHIVTIASGPRTHPLSAATRPARSSCCRSTLEWKWTRASTRSSWRAVAISYSYVRIKGLANILRGGNGMWLDRFVTNQAPGLLVLHGYGNVFERTLAPGESIQVEPGSMLYKDASVTLQAETIKLSSGIFGGTSMYLASLTGPGRVGHPVDVPPPRERGVAEMSGMTTPTVCPYCGTHLGAAGPSSPTCPACGAPLDIAVSVSASGWIELPAARDMARIQADIRRCRSRAHRAGGRLRARAGRRRLLPASRALVEGPTVARHSNAGSRARGSAAGRVAVHMLDATGPGRIAFIRDAAGEMLAIPLHPGVSVDVREHLFMVATHSVSYDWFDSGVWFQTRSGDEVETHYPIGQLMDRFTAPAQPGLLLIHAHGSAFLRQLAEGERILVKPSGLLYKDSTVSAHLHFERPHASTRSLWTWGERYMWLALWGPGRVALQSAYGHTHDPGGPIIGGARMTEYQW